MAAGLEQATIVESKARWDEMLPEDALVYSTWEWGSICEAFGHRRYYLGIQEDGQLLAGLPLMYSDTRLFGRALVSMPYSPYGEIVTRDTTRTTEHQTALFEDLKRLASQLPASHASIRGFGDKASAEDYRTVSRFVTFEVDLSKGAEETWDDEVESRFRRSVRKSRKENVRVEQGFDASTFEDYYEMYLDNMRYHGTPPYSRQFFRNVHRYLSKLDAFEMYLAYTEDDTPINGVTVFRHGDRAIYWTGVADHEYRELNGGSRLLWEAIEDSCERGFDVFDLSRTREDTGVYDYKKSIGRPVDLVDLHYAPDQDLDLVDPEAEKYERIRTVWRKLPLRATEYIGPPIRKRLTL